MNVAPNDSLTAPSPRSTRRRTALLWSLAGLLVLLGGTAFYLLRDRDADNALDEAIAEADRLDPGWRFDELEARRKPVKAEDNSARVVAQVGTKAMAILNTANVRQDLLNASEPIEKLKPTVALNDVQTVALRTALLPLAPVLAEAHKIAGMRDGRFGPNVKAELDWVIANVDQANIAIWLLLGDASLQVQDGDADAAWTACQAALNVARSLGDEPLDVIQLTRARQVGQAIRAMERTLAQLHVDGPRLAETQELLDDELQHPTLLISLRGSRAMVHHCCTLLEHGKASLAEAKRQFARAPGPPGMAEEVRGYLSRSTVRPAHAWLLQYTTQAVEIAKGPEREIEPKLKELEQTRDEGPELARIFAPKFDRPLEWARKHRALVGCALAGLAVERYRLQHQRWPATLDDLVKAKLFAAVPIDPYDCRPLRYRALADGAVVFSIGPDGRGNGAAIADDDRLAFRLWNADERRK